MKRIVIAAVLLVGVVVWAADVVPSNWITNYTYSASNVTIPGATFTANGATTADLDQSTGDAREVTKAFLEEVYDYQTYLRASTTNAPSYMNIQKAQTIDDDGQLRTVFTVTFTSDISTSAIVSE